MPDAVVQDPLRLDRCPTCGYALEGLAPEGVCPECGVAYDQSEVVLHGYGAGRFLDVATARPRAAVAMGAVSLAIAWWYFRDSLRNGLHPGDAFWPAFLVLSLAWGLWKRSTSDMPGLVQVRLSSRGAVQINNPTAGPGKAAKVTPWADIAEVRIRSAAPDRLRIKLVRRKTFVRGAPVLVDADVECGAAQGQALVERVRAWQTQAPASGEGASQQRGC
jgi:hypothetical protein